MSKIDTTELGIAIVCGATAAGLASGVADIGSGLAIALGAIVSGVTLILQGYISKDASSVPEEADEEPKKRQQANKKETKNKTPVKKPAAKPVVEPQSEQKGKAKKKKKKGGGGEASPIQKPTSKAKKPVPKDSSSDDDEESTTPKGKFKAQSQIAYEKLKAKAGEAGKKAVESGKKAVESGKKAVGEAGKKIVEVGKKGEEAVKKVIDQKRESASQKKAQTKLRKEAQKLAEQQQQRGNVFQAQMRNREGEDKDVKGWEVVPKKQPRTKEGKEKKVEHYADEVKVAPSALGAVIGSNGSALKKLSDTLGVKIQLPKKDSGQAILITGEKSAVLEAKRAISDIEKHGYSSVTHPQHKTEGLQLTSSAQLGAIIGKGGKFVQDIQQRTGAKINLPKKGSTDTTVGIVGRPQDIEAARTAIQDLLDQGYSSITHPGWIKEEVEFPNELLGRLIGDKGATIQAISTKFGVRIDTPRKDEPQTRQDVIFIKGTPAKIELTKKHILEHLFNDEEEVEDEVTPAADDPWQQDPEKPEW